MNEKQLVSIWRYVVDITPERILQVALEGDLKSNIRNDTGGVQEGLGSKFSRKRRGVDLMRS